MGQRPTNTELIFTQHNSGPKSGESRKIDILDFPEEFDRNESKFRYGDANGYSVSILTSIKERNVTFNQYFGY